MAYLLRRYHESDERRKWGDEVVREWNEFFEYRISNDLSRFFIGKELPAVKELKFVPCQPFGFFS
jgi:hypothetical protein